jgi:hypothetical protein
LTAKSVQRVAVFIRIECEDDEENPTVIRLWIGFGDLEVPTNDLDDAGEQYSGFGAAIGMPELESLINGASARADFGLSGVTAAIADLAELEEDLVIGAAVNVGVCEMDEQWQMTDTVFWLWDGRADVLQTDLKAQSDGSQTYQVQISVATASASRSRAQFANWTDAQHQLVHPGDLFLSQMPTSETTKRWPGG